jgi:2-dehydro-3-deoxygalactonokinase
MTSGSSLCPPPAIYVDMGTTNTRGWLVHEHRVVAAHRVAAGARNTARTGSRVGVEESLRAVCHELESAGRRSGVAPAAVVGTGMIGSPLGLVDIPHLCAPVGLAELTAAAIVLDVPAVTLLPIVLIPGVRSPGCDGSVQGEATDVMRGEEALCVGLLQQGRIRPASRVLNLGSHWKLIRLDSHGRIAQSETTLSGELAHVAWRQTILASALPDERPTALDAQWIRRGRVAMHERGLARALFCVRLIAQRNEGSASDRLAFLYGAFLESDLSPWLRRGQLEGSVAVVGVEALAGAWAAALGEHGVRTDVVTKADAESAVLVGLAAVFSNVAPRLGIGEKVVGSRHQGTPSLRVVSRGGGRNQ